MRQYVKYAKREELPEGWYQRSRHVWNEISILKKNEAIMWNVYWLYHVSWSYSLSTSLCLQRNLLLTVPTSSVKQRSWEIQRNNEMKRSTEKKSAFYQKKALLREEKLREEICCRGKQAGEEKCRNEEEGGRREENVSQRICREEKAREEGLWLKLFLKYEKANLSILRLHWYSQRRDFQLWRRQKKATEGTQKQSYLLSALLYIVQKGCRAVTPI